MKIPRIYSIDLLKAVALLLVINSHMARLYGSMAALATGGAIGYALFFFSAGYLMESKHQAALKEGKPVEFLPFLGNRIWRIYPTAWIWIAFLCLILGWQFSPILLFDAGCWLIGCIMVYYVLLWLVQRFCPKHKPLLAVLVFLASVALFFVEGGYEDGIYGNSQLKLLFFFLPVLMGSWLAEKSEQLSVPVVRTLPKVLGWVILALVGYYALAAFKLSSSFEALQLLSIPALLMVTYYCWQLCDTDDLKALASSRLVRWLSGIGLEAYIIQWSIITICYRLDPAYGWLMAWILILLLASVFHMIVKWVRLIFNYLF